MIFRPVPLPAVERCQLSLGAPELKLLRSRRQITPGNAGSSQGVVVAIVVLVGVVSTPLRSAFIYHLLDVRRSHHHRRKILPHSGSEASHRRSPARLGTCEPPIELLALEVPDHFVELLCQLRASPRGPSASHSLPRYSFARRRGRAREGLRPCESNGCGPGRSRDRRAGNGASWSPTPQRC
jgi:hypothetical protein